MNQAFIVVSKSSLNRFWSWFNSLVCSKYFLWFCFLLALALRLAWVVFIQAEPSGDYRWYYLRGLAISSGEGYSISGRLTAFFPVGYPAFLGLIFTIFGSSVFIAKLANICLYLIALQLTYWLAKDLFKSEFTARLSVLILAVFPSQISYVAILSSENLFLTLLMIGITLIWMKNDRPWMLGASGIVFGLTCLVKPQALFVPLLVLIIYHRREFSQERKKLLVQLGLVYIALFITMLPWMVRNYRVFNSFVFVSNNGGYNLLIANNPWARGDYNDEWKFDLKLADVVNSAPDEKQGDDKARGLGLAYLVSHPGKTLQRLPLKLWHLYGKDIESYSYLRDGLNSEGLKRATYAVQFLGQFVYLLFLGTFLYALYHVKHLPVLGLGIIGYFTLIYLVFFGNGRFHFPLIPWMAMYVSALFETRMRRETCI